MKRNKVGVSAFSPDQMLFTMKEAARYCGYSTKAGFLRRVNRGDVQGEPFDRRHAGLMFSREELDKFIDKRVPPAEEGARSTSNDLVSPSLKGA